MLTTLNLLSGGLPCRELLAGKPFVSALEKSASASKQEWEAGLVYMNIIYLDKKILVTMPPDFHTNSHAQAFLGYCQTNYPYFT